MKNITLASLFAIVVITTFSCKKTTPSGPNVVGSASFKGTTFALDTASFGAGLVLYSKNDSNSVIIAFGTQPANGIYTVTSNNVSANTVNVIYRGVLGRHIYSADTGIITVSVSGGKISAATTGAGLMMYAYPQPIDSGLLTFSFHQE